MSTRGQQTISMTVFSGSTLEDVVVAFRPSGLTFNPPATLELCLSGNLSREDANAVEAALRTVDHVSGGQVEKIQTKGKKDGRAGWKVTVKIPGFSLYSWGSGSMYDGKDDPMYIPEFMLNQWP